MVTRRRDSWDDAWEYLIEQTDDGLYSLHEAGHMTIDEIYFPWCRPFFDRHEETRANGIVTVSNTVETMYKGMGRHSKSVAVGLNVAMSMAGHIAVMRHLGISAVPEMMLKIVERYEHTSDFHDNEAVALKTDADQIRDLLYWDQDETKECIKHIAGLVLQDLDEHDGMLQKNWELAKAFYESDYDYMIRLFQSGDVMQCSKVLRGSIDKRKQKRFLRRLIEIRELSESY